MRMASEPDSSSKEQLAKLPPGAQSNTDLHERPETSPMDSKPPSAEAAVAENVGKKFKNPDSSAPIFQSDPTPPNLPVGRKRTLEQVSMESADSLFKDETSMGSDPKVSNHEEMGQSPSDKIPSENCLPTLHLEVNIPPWVITDEIIDQQKPGSPNSDTSNSVNSSNIVGEHERQPAVVQERVQLNPTMSSQDAASSLRAENPNRDLARQNIWFAHQLKKLELELESYTDGPVVAPSERKRRRVLEKIRRHGFTLGSYMK